jgi:predicted dehydrogenase
VGSTPTSDLEVVFASPDVDAVLIATPGTHAEIANRALTARKHVLAEKPLAFTTREVRELEALAKAKGLIAQVGYMKMFDPLSDVVASEISELRGIRLIRITVSHPADEGQLSHLRLGPVPRDADSAVIASSQSYDLERAREALPGADDELVAYYMNVLNGSVIHEFSLLRAVGLALPSEWQAVAVTPLGGAEPASLRASSTVDGVEYLLSWNWLPEYPEYDEELSVFAANGRLDFLLAKPYLLEERSRLVSRRHEGELRKVTSYTAGHETGFLRQLDAFAAAIRTGATNPASFGGAAHDIAALQEIAVALAASSGTVIVPEHRSQLS